MFAYPSNALFGRVLPKNKIYGHARPSAAVKELFVRQVEQIVWQYKLAPETINMAGTTAVPEILVFRIILKENELKPEVLRCIDTAIPFPILFELCCEDRVQSVAAYKRPSESDATKWVVGDTFAGDWQSVDAPRTPLPVMFDLAGLYEHLLRSVLPYSARAGEGLQAHVARVELARLKQRELERCTAKLQRERQFNRKVTINAEVRGLTQELARITSPES